MTNLLLSVEGAELRFGVPAASSDRSSRIVDLPINSERVGGAPTRESFFFDPTQEVEGSFDASDTNRFVNLLAPPSTQVGDLLISFVAVVMDIFVDPATDISAIVSPPGWTPLVEPTTSDFLDTVLPDRDPFALFVYQKEAEASDLSAPATFSVVGSGFTTGNNRMNVYANTYRIPGGDTNRVAYAQTILPSGVTFDYPALAVPWSAPTLDLRLSGSQGSSDVLGTPYSSDTFSSAGGNVVGARVNFRFALPAGSAIETINDGSITNRDDTIVATIAVGAKDGFDNDVLSTPAAASVTNFVGEALYSREALTFSGSINQQAAFHGVIPFAAASGFTFSFVHGLRREFGLDPVAGQELTWELWFKLARAADDQVRVSYELSSFNLVSTLTTTLIGQKRLARETFPLISLSNLRTVEILGDDPAAVARPDDAIVLALVRRNDVSANPYSDTVFVSSARLEFA